MVAAAGATLSGVLLSGCPLVPQMPAPIAPLDGSVISGDSAALRAVTIGTSEVTFFGRRVVAPDPDFTMVALPDTQFYAQDFPATFRAQTQWIIEQRAARNIISVLHLGDIVDDADELPQWQAADAAIAVLESDPNLPFGLGVGNHDEFPRGDPLGTQNFNSYFGVDRFAGSPWYGGHYGVDNDNHYITFSAGAMDFVAVFLEFDRDANPDVLAWAKDVLQQNADRRAIIVTHFALVGHALRNKLSDQGRAVRDALLSLPNVDLFLGGHFCEAGRRVDEFGGKPVISILADYQCRPDGGEGWLRIMEFSPAANELRVKTYSPTRGEFLSGPRHEFTLDYQLHADVPFERLGSATPDANTKIAEFSWTGLAPGATYEWFATRGGSIAPSGPAATFQTAP